jgi:hypothetical protein
VFLTTPLGIRVRQACSTKLDLPVRIHRLASHEWILIQTLDALFWDAIFSMDITSAEGLSNVSTLAHSPSNIIVARNLQGDRAQSFVDIIDQVSGPGEHASTPRMLMAGHSFSRYRTSMRNYLDEPRGCSIRSVQPAEFCLLHISFTQSSPMSASLGGAAASRT